MEKILNLKEHVKEISIIADALSNEKRLLMLQLIKKQGDDLSHKNLADKIGVKSSSISFHLAPLINAGIVTEEVSKGLKGRNKKVPKLKINKIVIEL